MRLGRTAASPDLSERSPKLHEKKPDAGCQAVSMGGREARAAERKAQRKALATAEVALEKIQKAKDAEALEAAIKAAMPVAQHLPALEAALPAAQKRVAELRHKAEKSGLDDFMSRVEEAEKRDSQAQASRKQSMCAPRGTSRCVRRGTPICSAAQGHAQGLF